MREWRRTDRRVASLSCVYRSLPRSLEAAAERLVEGYREMVDVADCELLEKDDSVAAVLGCEDDVAHGDTGGPLRVEIDPFRLLLLSNCPDFFSFSGLPLCRNHNSY